MVRMPKLYFVFPLLCAAAWWGMLVAMLVAWCVQGKPMYLWQSSYQDPIYISGIGATNLQPLFIVGLVVQALFFMATVVGEYRMRRAGHLERYAGAQRILALTCIVGGAVGQVGIVLVSCFKTTRFKVFHLSMVMVFVLGVFFACVFNLANTGLFAFRRTRSTRYYVATFALKSVWLVVGVAFVVLFFAFMGTGRLSLSSVFEWAISFWYGFLMLLWAADLRRVIEPDTESEKSVYS